jgi:hypothetical protein
MIEINVGADPLAFEATTAYLLKRLLEELRLGPKRSARVGFVMPDGNRVSFRMTFLAVQMKGAPRRQAAPDGARIKE